MLKCCLCGVSPDFQRIQCVHLQEAVRTRSTEQTGNGGGCDIQAGIARIPYGTDWDGGHFASLQQWREGLPPLALLLHLHFCCIYIKGGSCHAEIPRPDSHIRRAVDEAVQRGACDIPDHAGRERLPRFPQRIHAPSAEEQLPEEFKPDEGH